MELNSFPGITHVLFEELLRSPSTYAIAVLLKEPLPNVSYGTCLFFGIQNILNQRHHPFLAVALTDKTTIRSTVHMVVFLIAKNPVDDVVRDFELICDGAVR